MRKVATAFYSTAVPHKQMDGLYMATFALAGEAPMWVNGTDGKPKTFRDAQEAELAGFRLMASKLNKARDVQTFHTKGGSGGGKNTSIRVFRASELADELTVEKVFGKK
jgi:hypothetical protein